MIHLLLLLLSFLFTSNWAEANPSYDDLFKFSLEVCSFTQRDHGNPGGHTLIFLKGACMDKVSPLPQLKLCSESDKRLDPNIGTALGANAIFKSRNWVGIEGKQFALYGDLKPEDPINDESYNKIIDKVLRSGSYRNLSITDADHDQWIKYSPSISLERYVVGRSLGIDFAVALERSGSCWKLPISEKQTTDLIDEANRMNHSIDDQHPYRWNFIMNNCDHFVCHMLATAHLKKPRETNLSPLGQLNWIYNFKQLEAPTTTLEKIGEKMKRSDLPSVKEVYSNPTLREQLLKYDQVGYPPGTLLELIPFHHAGNFSFSSHTARIGSRIGDQSALEKMEKDSDLTGLKTSLKIYYEKLLMAQREHHPKIHKIKSEATKAEDVTRDLIDSKYTLWLERSLKEVKNYLDQFTDEPAIQNGIQVKEQK